MTSFHVLEESPCESNVISIFLSRSSFIIIFLWGYSVTSWIFRQAITARQHRFSLNETSKVIASYFYKENFLKCLPFFERMHDSLRHKPGGLCRWFVICFGWKYTMCRLNWVYFMKKTTWYTHCLWGMGHVEWGLDQVRWTVVKLKKFES